MHNTRQIYNNEIYHFFPTSTVLWSSSPQTRPEASDNLKNVSFDLFCTVDQHIYNWNTEGRYGKSEGRYMRLDNQICNKEDEEVDDEENEEVDDEEDEEVDDEEDEDIDNIVNSDMLNSDDIENIDMLENVKHNIGLYVKKANLQFLEPHVINFDPEKGKWGAYVFTPDTYKEEDKEKNEELMKEKCMVLIRKLKQRFPRLYIQLVKKTGKQKTRLLLWLEIENEVKKYIVKKSISVYTLVLHVDFEQTRKYKALEVLKRSQPAILDKLYHPINTKENKETGEKGWLARNYEKDFRRAEKTVKELLQYIY